MFLLSNAVRLARKQPRRPDFLLEPLQSQRPLRYGTLGGRGRSCDPGLPLSRACDLGSEGGWSPFLPVQSTAA